MNVLVSRNSRHIWHRPLERLLYSRYDPLPSIRRREVSNTTVEDGSDNNRTRNIGIIAHIDAGKTTTTERMLYYSGCTRRIGDVDDGSTVTDFLPAERARGITIQSAAVTFNWPPSENIVLPKSRRIPRSQIRHTVNLIDTPGHADFTFEVLRSLRILDGAVCVLDAVAGVEAQTEKVWSQASTYRIPRIVFINKLDRDGAAFGRTVKEIGSRLRGWPAVCQIPWWDGGKGRFMGVGDAIGLTALKWAGGGDGKSVQSFTLQELEGLDHGLAVELMKARTALVDTLCEFDEELLNSWLELNDDSLAIPAQEIRESLRRCILDGSGRLIPVFAGASFRNIGVQPLLDAVNDLLPDPTERPDPEINAGPVKGTLSELLRGQLQIENPASRQVDRHSKAQMALATNIEACALAFKVVNDPRRGVLVYIRVYSGVIKRNASLWNTNLHVTERAQRLLQMQASEAVEISSIPAGQIGVIVGLKYARTGDTLISYPGANPKTGPPGSLNSLQLRPIIVPPPVFFAAVEPHSLGEEKSVEDILALLLREDPSLHVNVDEESRQMLLSGMGELHLEIARDRLIKDFKAKASMGSIEIGYRETVISGPFNQKAVFDREIAGKRGKAACGVTMSSLNDEIVTHLENTIERDGNAITVIVETSSPRDPEETIPLPEELTLDIVHEALLNGASAALARGPRRGFPMHSTHVTLTFSTLTDIFGLQTTPASIASAARLAVQATMREVQSVQGIGLLEPVMKVVISCDEASLGSVIHDISSARGGHVLSLRNLSDANDTSEAGADERAPIDISRIYAPPDPFAPSGGDGGSNDYIGPGQQRHVTAKVPLKEMLGYLKHLRSLTGGRGTFIMSIDRFERLSGPREKAV